MEPILSAKQSMYLIYRYVYDVKGKKYIKKSQSLQVTIFLVSGTIWPLIFRKYLEHRTSLNVILDNCVQYVLQVHQTSSSLLVDICVSVMSVPKLTNGRHVQFAEVKLGR